MAKKTGSHVPKFGDWNNNNGNIAPYTAVFDKARKNRVKEGVKIMNPNDPEENPEAFAVVEKEKVKESGVMMIRSPNVVEEKNRRDSSESSSHVGRASLSLNRRRSNESELSAYSEKMSLECNTSSLILRQRRQQRLREKNEKKKSMDYSSSKRTTGAIEHHRRHSSITDIDMIPIPKFMDWDESNPKSSEDVTYKFNIVKKEKKTISEKFSAALSSEPNNVNSGREKPFSISKIICCFHPFPRGRACF